MEEKKELLDQDERVVEIGLERLRGFVNHPFKVHAIISNVGNREYEIKMGDKVGQLVIMPVLIPDFTFESWEERGNGAFGSTGREG